MSKFIIGVALATIVFISWINYKQAGVIARQREAIQYLLSTCGGGSDNPAPPTSFTAQR